MAPDRSAHTGHVIHDVLRSIDVGHGAYNANRVRVGQIAIANVRSNVQRLQEATPILADMVKAGKLRVVGAVYDLPTGKVGMV